MTLRVIFMGTPDFSVPLLSEIVGQGHDVAACYTRAPKPGGRRGLEQVKSPVHQTAEKFNIPVFTPKTLREAESAATFRAHDGDVAVVAAYGLILPQEILDAPRLGCLNLHASLLPRWRGAAPIQRAIMAGDKQTGVMVMRMDAGLDTGDIAMAEHVPVGPDATAGELHDTLMISGAGLMVRALSALEQGSLQFAPQPESGVTYAEKISKAECRIDWSLNADQVHNHIRGLSPFPGAYFEANLGKRSERVKVLRSSLCGDRVSANSVAGQCLDDQLTIACGNGAVRLVQVQRAGKAPMSARDFLNGAKLEPGSRLA